MVDLQLILELMAETGALVLLYLGYSLSSGLLKVGHHVAGIFVQDAVAAQYLVDGIEICCVLGVRLEDAAAC